MEFIPIVILPIQTEFIMPRSPALHHTTHCDSLKDEEQDGSLRSSANKSGLYPA